MDNLKSLTQKENIILSNIALEKFEIYKKLILEWNEYKTFFRLSIAYKNWTF